MHFLQEAIGSTPFALLSGFAGRVLDSLLIGAVLAWLLSLGQGRHKRIARAQIAEQLCRVFGMRLYRPRNQRAVVIEHLLRGSLQGWQSLDRLQWNLDLHRAQLSLAELTLLQGLIEDLLRIKANQHTAEIHLFDEYLPAAAHHFLPAPLREKFLDHAKYVATPELVETASMAQTGG